jgi:hypothetical protein
VRRGRNRTKRKKGRGLLRAPRRTGNRRGLLRRYGQRFRYHVQAIGAIDFDAEVELDDDARAIGERCRRRDDAGGHARVVAAVECLRGRRLHGQRLAGHGRRVGQRDRLRRRIEQAQIGTAGGIAGQRVDLVDAEAQRDDRQTRVVGEAPADLDRAERAVGDRRVVTDLFGAVTEFCSGSISVCGISAR